MTHQNTPLKAPFPWFGGKSAVASLVWERFGVVRNYVEPFAGSLAVLLGRPTPFSGPETVNDLDGLLCNAWRAIKADPAGVAHHASDPPSELDLHARHLRLVAARDELTEHLIADPEWYDTRLAGWWVWGACCWIGSGWCSGKGPWVLREGRVVERQAVEQGACGVHRKLPHLGDGGQGVHRQLPHLGDGGQGVHRPVPVEAWLTALSSRLARVRIACGDWTRVTGPSVTHRHGLTAVFLDPPYGADNAIDYAADANTISVREWALEAGENPLMRIVLCGYAGGGHEALESHGWTVEAWKARGGFGSQGDGEGRANSTRERIWFSPHCQGHRQLGLFDAPPTEARP